MAITTILVANAVVVLGILCRQTCCKSHQFDALERPRADEHDIARIDVNHDIEHVTEQCRLAVQVLFVRALSAS